MKGLARWLPALAILGCLIVALGRLFLLDSESGNSFPFYSSFRSDRWGTRALYESLSSLEGLRVSRETQIVSKKNHREPGLLIVPGMSRYLAEVVNRDVLNTLKGDAVLGSRVVIGFYNDPEESEERTLRENTRRRVQREEWKRQREKAASEEKNKNEKTPNKDDEKAKTENDPAGTGEPDEENTIEAWNDILEFTPHYTEEAFGSAATVRAPGASVALPPTIVHDNDLFFETKETAGWNVLYTRGGKKVALERRYGKGSFILLADMNVLGNGHLTEPGAARIISYLLSDYTSVLFLENVNGIHSEVGIGHLARRYGLGGAYLLCLVLGTLYLWRHLTPFTPTREPLDSDAVRIRALDGEDGFTRMINRSLGKNGLFDACVRSWQQVRKATRRPHEEQRFETALKDDQPRHRAVERYNAVVRKLKHF